jgi:hypothetical protein
VVKAWAQARRIYEEEVRAVMNIPDSPASLPGVFRELEAPQKAIYEKLAALSWMWALKYLVVLSFGKRLGMDTMPSTAELTTADVLAIILGSYESAGDGNRDVLEEDGSKGLSGGFEGNMLHEFAQVILTRGDTTLKKPIIVVLDVLSPNPANARALHQGDKPSANAEKMDCREYFRHETEGERQAQASCISETLYGLKEIRDISGKEFIAGAMGNLQRLDIDPHCERGNREEIELSDMTHLEAQTRFFTALKDSNIDRSDATWTRLRARLYPALAVDPAEVGPLRQRRLNRPEARKAWLKASKINARKSLTTRGYRLAAAAGEDVADDDAARKYAINDLQKLARAGLATNATLLGLFKLDGTPDVSTYSLGNGNEYLKRFRKATAAEKEKFRTEIRAKALAVRKKGAVESEKVVKRRLVKMELAATEVMTYRLGKGKLWYNCWEILTTEEKAAARALMRAEALVARKRGTVESANVVKQRLVEMELPDTDSEVMNYRLGGGSAWYVFWGILTVQEKDAAWALVCLEALAARKRGAVESANVVKQRLVEMELPDTDSEAMTYRLGGGSAWYVFWGILTTEEKDAAWSVVRLEAQKIREDTSKLNVAEQAKRVVEMGLPQSVLYGLGQCNVYYYVWTLLTVREKEESRAQILDVIVETRASGSISTARDTSLDAPYICAAKMHPTHELFSHRAFHSHTFGYAVCGAPLDMSKRAQKAGWRHACKVGPPLATSGANRNKCKKKWPRLLPAMFFRVCPVCLIANRSQGICTDCKSEYR